MSETKLMAGSFSEWPLFVHAGLLVGCAIVIAISGWHLAKIADELADRTGLGEAITGALFLGASTSLPGLITSVTAATNDFPTLAVSNAIGGIAAQTAFLAIADLAYKKVNLEHAAASATNIMQGTLLICLLAIPLLAINSPEFSWWGVHPASVVLLAAYLYGMRIVSKARANPMWTAKRTAETRQDVPNHARREGGLGSLWGGFVVIAAILGSAGWLLAHSGMVISEKTGLSESAVGGVFTAVATSLPELVTAVAAVRQGALTLAVSDIIGGNVFDTLFLAVADVGYRQGSIYHAVTGLQAFWVSLTVLMTGVLLMGMVRREKKGVANIGFESFFLLLFYLSAVVFVFLHNPE